MLTHTEIPSTFIARVGGGGVLSTATTNTMTTYIPYVMLSSNLPNVAPHFSHTYFALFAWSLDGTTAGGAMEQV